MGEVEKEWEEGNRIKVPINGSSVTSKYETGIGGACLIPQLGQLSEAGGL